MEDESSYGSEKEESNKGSDEFVSDKSEGKDEAAAEDQDEEDFEDMPSE